MQSRFPLRAYESLRRWLFTRATWLPASSLVTVWLVAIAIAVCSSTGDPLRPEAEPHAAVLVRKSNSNDNEFASVLSQDSIQRWLKVGRPTSLKVHGSIVAKIAAPDEQVPITEQLFLGFEWTADSVIESIQEDCVVELRTFQCVAEVFLIGEHGISHASRRDQESSALSDLAAAGVQHIGTRRVPIRSLCDVISPENDIAANSNTQAFWHVASMSGKRVRLTHRLGGGVELIEPIGCQLSQLELGWLDRTTLDWHYGLQPATQTHHPFTKGASVDEVMPTSVRIFPPWSQLAGSAQTRLVGPAGNTKTVKLAWTDDKSAFRRWFPSGHLLHDVYTLRNFPTVELCITREQHDPAPYLPATGKPVPAQISRADGPYIPASIQPFAYILTYEGSDLALAIGLLLVVSTCLFLVGVHVSPSKTNCSRIALAVSAILLAYIEYLHGQASLVNLLPLSNVIVLSNWLPLVAAMLAGLLYGRDDIPAWRRITFAQCLLAAGWFSVLCTTTPQPVQSGCQFANGVCVQSSQATCSAAAAVSLLEFHNIPSDESELARMCLTSRRGTNMQGIFRGLTLKTQGTPYRVVHLQCEFDCVQDASLWPMLIPVRQDAFTPMTFKADDPPDYLGFSDSNKRALLKSLLLVNHCVVLYGITPSGDAIIGDPSNGKFGRVRWNPTQLKKSWLGEGFRLEAIDDLPPGH